MKRILLILLLTAPAWPQMVPYAPQAWLDHTEGVSVEALGRGGASIALADDAAGVWHNPAGIAALRDPKACLGLEGVRARVNVREAYAQDDTAEGDMYGLGYVAAAKPFKIGEREFSFWAGYRPMVEFPDMDRSWTETAAQQGHGFRSHATFSQAPADAGIALATRLTPRLSAGIHLHYLQADVLEKWMEARPAPWSDEWSYDLKYDFSALLWDVGLQADAGRGLRFGAVYRSGKEAGLDYQINRDWGGVPLDPIADHTHIRWPDGWGLGAAWSALPPLKIALDYTRTNWSDARIDRFDSGVSPVEWNQVGFPTFYFGQKDTSSWRLGAEYALPPAMGMAWTFRAGCMRYEQNMLAPFVHLYTMNADRVALKGITLGATLAWRMARFDAAFVHVSGHPQGDGYGISQDRFLLSTTLQLVK